MVHLKDVHYIEVIEPIPAKEDVDVDGYGYSIMEHEKNKFLKGVVYEKNSKVF